LDDDDTDDDNHNDDDDDDDRYVIYQIGSRGDATGEL